MVSLVLKGNVVCLVLKVPLVLKGNPVYLDRLDHQEEFNM
jgi:hypothetical protein